MTIAHRSQYFHGVRIRNCVLEFSPDWSTSAALQRDCCVGIRDAHSGLVPIVASNQPITNTDSSGNRAFPVIVREQEFTFNFYWHEPFRLTYNQHRNDIGAGDSRLGVDLLGQGKPPCPASWPDAHRPTHGHRRGKLGDRNIVVVASA